MAPDAGMQKSKGIGIRSLRNRQPRPILRNQSVTKPLPDPFVLRRLAGGTEGWLVRLIWLVLFGIATVAWLAVLAWAAVKLVELVLS